MRIRRLLAAALLSTTCLTTPAHAGPAMAFVGGFLNALGAGTWLANAAWVGAWSAGFNTASWLAGGSFLARIVTSVGLSALAQSLMPTPKMPAPAEIMANYAQDVTFIERVYGRVRKGGPYALAAFATSDVTNALGVDGRAKRHYGVLIAAHPTRGPHLHYLDKWQVETDADGTVTTSPIWYDGWKGGAHPECYHGAIRPYTGQPGQVADPIWSAAFPEVTAADDFAGLSYAALYAARSGMEVFQDVYPGGREWQYAPVWDGCDTIYDPRSESQDWSNNAALVIADVARWYGKEVDWPEVAHEADVCDQLVTNRDGGTQRRWTINTVLRSNMTWEEVRSHLQMCCDAYFYERTDGKIGFRVGYYSAPTVTLTDEDFLSLSLRHKASGPDPVASYAMRYVEPARDWSQEVSGAVGGDVLGDRQEQECYGIDSHNQAWRVIWRWSKSARPEWQISGAIKAIGYQCISERFLRIQHAEQGLDCIVEVATLARDASSHTWQLEAVSVEPEDFAPDALTLEPPRTMRATLAEETAVASPASLTGAVVEGTGGAAMVEYTWPEQTGDLRQQLRFRAPAHGVPDWQTVDVGADQSSYVLTGLRDGAVVEAQLRNRTGGNRVSPWVPEVPLTLTAVANTVAPAAMQYFSGTVGGSSIGLTFIPPNDPVYAAARIYRAPGGSPFGAATHVGTEYGAPNLADEWTDAAPGVGSHSYWIEPVNGSGVPGPRSGPITLTIT